MLNARRWCSACSGRRVDCLGIQSLRPVIHTSRIRRRCWVAKPGSELLLLCGKAFRHFTGFAEPRWENSCCIRGPVASIGSAPIVRQKFSRSSRPPHSCLPQHLTGSIAHQINRHDALTQLVSCISICIIVCLDQAERTGTPDYEK